MKNRKRYGILASAGMLAAFVLWTMAVCLVDVRAIGPKGSAVGFASLNQFVHGLTSVHMSLYRITDWLGLVPIVVAMGFAMLGLGQWIRRRHIARVDRSILVLGGFYAVVVTAYMLFEAVVINYRPVLMDGILEASYPSSTTMLVMCVMPTAAMQLRVRIRNPYFRRWVVFAIDVFTVFMVVGRLASGVHWFTDIVGGAMLSTGLVMLYRFVSGLNER